MTFGSGGHNYFGYNAVSEQEYTFGLINSAASWDLAITYEAPIPEPATARLCVAGAAGFLFLRRLRRTRRS
jgi:hypothetical protein